MSETPEEYQAKSAARMQAHFEYLASERSAKGEYQGYKYREVDDSEEDCKRGGIEVWNGTKWVDVVWCSLNPWKEFDEMIVNGSINDRLK